MKKVINREKRNNENNISEEKPQKNSMLDGELDYNSICFGRLCL